jgi:hypothetical protein
MRVSARWRVDLAPSDDQAGSDASLRNGEVFAIAAIVIVGLLVFVPGLRAGLASEDFDFYRAAHAATFQQVLQSFIPNNYFWYRPFQELGYWTEVHLFGFNPPAFHAVSLTGHLVSSILLFRLVRTLGCGLVASLVTALVFVTTVHAHEVVWWWADLHYAFAGPLIVGSLLAWFSHRKLLTVVLASAALLTDESSLLIAPLVMMGQFLLADETLRWYQRLLGAVRSAVPLVALVAIYIAFRIGIGGGIWSESAPCHSPSCVAAGVANYAARLVLRPDRAYGLYEQHKLILTALGSVAVVVVGVVIAMRWRYRRIIAFGAGWTTLTVVFFVWALWPYASDRFMYYPDMGIALALGGFTQEAIQMLVGGNRLARFAVPAAALVLALWVGAGIHMLEVRAGGWIRAGQQAQLIVNNVYAQIPNAPPDTLIEIDGVPDSSLPMFPPGNTGPYLFRNGLQGALRLKFGREDIWVVWTGHLAQGLHSDVIHLRVDPSDSIVVVSGS